MNPIRAIRFALACLAISVTVPAWGDLAALMSREVAVKAVQAMPVGSEIRHFCAPCGDTSARSEKVARCEAVAAGIEKFHEVKINGNPVDLAYVYVLEEGRWANLAMRLGLDVAEVPEYLAGGSEATLPDFGQRVYKGLIDGKYGVMLSLSKTADTLTGDYSYDSKGLPIDLDGTLDSSGAFTVTEMTDGRKTGLLTGNLDKAAETLTGAWGSPDGKKNLPFEATLVAEIKSYDIKVKEKDLAIEGTIAYPVLRLKDGTAASAAGKHIEKALRDLYATFEKEMRETAQDPDFKLPEEMQPVTFGVDALEIALVTEELVSIVAHVYEYSGGAHPNSTSHSFNLAIAPSGTWRELTLKDFFRTDAPYLEELSRFAIKELGKQKAQWVVDGSLKSLSEEELATFAVTPRGIRLYFDPYAAGPYAQGPFTVMVPFDVLAPLAELNGPLAPFLTSTNR